MTPQEFANRIRTKYPGAYDRVPDDELTRRVIAKYPVYESQVNLGPTQTVKEPNALEGFAQGIAKGEVSTLKGLSDFGERIAGQTAGRFVNLVQGKGFKPTEFEGTFAKSVGQQNVDSLTKPEGTSENVGFAVERIAEFLAPSSAINKVKTAATGAIQGTSKLASVSRLGTKAAIEGATVGGQTAIQQGGQINDDVKVNAIVASLLPVVGGTVSKVLGATGKKIQQSVIKPSLRDVEDGFKIENVTKYKLGGNLNQVLAKTNTQLNKLSDELNKKLASSNASINLNKIYENTLQKLGGNKLQNFGENKGTQRVLQSLKEEIAEAAGQNGLVSIPEAQLVKRGAGTKGAWTFGNPDPDARASEKVYNAFYNELKNAIEENSPEGVRELNKQLSELIPISNAVIRRIPIAERSNAISITDGVGLFGAIFNPNALAIYGASRLSRSGRFGNLLTRASENLKRINNPIVKRVLGQ